MFGADETAGGEAQEDCSAGHLDDKRKSVGDVVEEVVVAGNEEKTSYSYLLYYNYYTGI